MGKQADRLAAKLRRGVARGASALVLAANRELRLPGPLGTPVQDGNARANWIPSVGQPHPGAAGDKASGNAANASGTAQVVAYHLGQGDLYLVNRTPYIRFLNSGSSKQAPALFVEAALERAKTKVNAMLAGRGNVGGIGLGAESSASDASGDMAGNLAGAYSPLGDD